MKALKLTPLILSMAIIFTLGCEKDKMSDRIKFLGSYTVVEACVSGTISYNVNITESSTSDKEVIITNFGDFSNGTTVRATITGNDLNIPSQTININGTAINISNGTGNLNGNILTIAYSYAIGSQSDNCSMTCTKL